MSIEITPPFSVFTDVDGEPLEDGYIYIGAANQNPQAVPIAVFWDSALTIPAEQPIRTLGGYPSRSGTPSRMYASGNACSIAIRNKNGTLIYSDINSTSGDIGLRQDLASSSDPSKGAAMIGYNQGTLHEWLGTRVLVTEGRFAGGAKLDGVSDDTAAFNAAIAYLSASGGGSLIVPFTGDFAAISSTVRVKENVSVFFELDTVIKSTAFNNPGVVINGASFSGSSVFELESNSSIINCAIYDSNQKYVLSSTSDSWNAGPNGISIGYSGYVASTGNPEVQGVRLQNIGFFGIKKGVVQHPGMENCESLIIDGMFGMPLETGVNLTVCFDIPRISNVHFNLNSYLNLLSGDISIYFHKVALECTVFKFGRVDEFVLTGCFAFGVKYFVHFYRDAYTGDTNSGGGGTLIGCSADIVHNGILAERGDFNFGVKWIGGFVTPCVTVGAVKAVAFRVAGLGSSVRILASDVGIHGSTGHPVMPVGSLEKPDYLFTIEPANSFSYFNFNGGFAFDFNISPGSVADQTSYIDVHSCPFDPASFAEKVFYWTTRKNTKLAIGGFEGDLVNMRAVPATATSAGLPGQVAMDGTYWYWYTGDGVTHTWVRVAGAAW